MEAKGADEVMISGSDEAEGSETTVEIKIKTLDSQTYTLRVNKRMPVPALKEQIASVTGVLSEQQRLICRGKVLKDDQLLSAYHVEDGHTLHLVVQQPLHSPLPSAAGAVGSETTADHPATDPSSNTARNRGNHASHSVVLGSFNLGDQGDGTMPDLNRIVSAILNTIGIPNSGTGDEAAFRRELLLERLERTSGAGGTPSSVQVLHDPTAPPQAQSDLQHSIFRFPSAVSVGSLQPPVIPDSLTTMLQYISHMRHEFSAAGRSPNSSAESAGTHNMEGGQGSNAGSHSISGQGLPTPASLAEVMLSTRQMLIEQAGECLSQLSQQLEDQASVTDPLVRMSIQSRAMRSGFLLQNLGTLLLELGRTTMTLRMGQTLSEAVVNAGPAVFISTTGPNPIMVQPLPFQPGTSFSAIPTGVQSGNSVASGITGSGFLPRNIDIRISTGRSVPTANASQGEQAGPQQTPSQPDHTSSTGVNFAPQTISGASGTSSFTGESGVRVVPIRTVVAAVPTALRRTPADSGSGAVGLFYPLIARFQHLSPGQSSDVRSPQPPGETQPSVPGSAHQPFPDPQQQQLGSSGGSARREGDSQTANCLSTNAACVDSEIGPSTDTLAHHQQGPQELSDNNSHCTQASDGQQNGQRSTLQMPSRFDQFLRTIFSAEQFHVSDIGDDQGTDAGTVGEQMEPPINAEANESQRAGVDPGVFFSRLVRRIMPFISQGTATETANTSQVRADRTAPDSNASQAEMENSSSGGNSCLRDPPSPPDSKRQKRE